MSCRAAAAACAVLLPRSPCRLLPQPEPAARPAAAVAWRGGRLALSRQLLQLLMLQALSCLQACWNGPHQPARWQQQQQLVQLRRQICLSGGHPTTLQSTCAARTGAAWGGVSCGCWAQQLQWQLRMSAVPAAMMLLRPRCPRLQLLQGLLQLLVLLVWLPFLTAGWAQHPAVCCKRVSAGKEASIGHMPQHMQLCHTQGNMHSTSSGCLPTNLTSLRALLCTTACSTRLQDWSFSLLYAPCSRYTPNGTVLVKPLCIVVPSQHYSKPDSMEAGDDRAAPTARHARILQAYSPVAAAACVDSKVCKGRRVCVNAPLGLPLLP